MKLRGTLLLAVLSACGPGDSAERPLADLTGSGESGKAAGVLDLRAPADTCSVHGDVLRENTIPITYGLPYFDSPTFDSVACPYVGHAVSGGCVMNEKDSYALVLFCPTCRAERSQRHASAHPDDTGHIPAGQDEPRLRTVVSLQQQRAKAAWDAAHPPVPGKLAR